MKKSLLTAAAIATALGAAAADNAVYTTTELGDVNGVADNGRYVVATDGSNYCSYLWQRDMPHLWINLNPTQENAETLPASQRILGTSAYDVTDDGMVVGSLIFADGSERPALWKEGEWIQLPIHASAMNTNFCMAVTADGSVIGGCMYISDKTPGSEIPGHYYPCRWTLGDDGEYHLKAYTDIDLPNHMGFYPRCMSPDGSVIAGEVYCGVASTLPAYLDADGGFNVCGTIVEKYEPWEYRGKWYCGMDADGKQIWTTDPDDPRIVLFEETYIDGVHDDNTHPFVGAFCAADWSGNYYGCRTVVANDGETLTDGACIWHMDTDGWEDSAVYSMYTAGLEGRILFCGGSGMIIDGRATTIEEEFGIETEQRIYGVSCVSRDGSVIGGMTGQLNAASGEIDYFPMVIVLDEPLVEVTGVSSPKGTSSAVKVSTEGGRILVEGAVDVAVYDLQGRLVGRGAETAVASGVYVVKADATSHKVMVK